MSTAARAGLRAAPPRARLLALPDRHSPEHPVPGPREGSRLREPTSTRAYGKRRAGTPSEPGQRPQLGQRQVDRGAGVGMGPGLPGSRWRPGPGCPCQGGQALLFPGRWRCLRCGCGGRTPGPSRSQNQGSSRSAGLAPGGRVGVTPSRLRGQACDGPSPAPSCGFPRAPGQLPESSGLGSGAQSRSAWGGASPAPVLWARRSVRAHGRGVCPGRPGLASRRSPARRRVLAFWGSCAEARRALGHRVGGGQCQLGHGRALLGTHRRPPGLCHMSLL